MPQSARPRGRQVNLFQALALLLALLLVAGVGGVLAAGLLMPAVAGASALTDATTEVFEDLPTELREEPLSEKSTVLAADGTTVLATFYHQNRIVVPLEQISADMQHAVVATEDKRFFQHGGIDPTGMLRAAAKNVLTDDLEGASTLTQQYVKNVLIESASRMDEAERELAIQAAREADGAAGVSRKLREAKLAIALEKQYTKAEILGKYLNIAQFGASVYGVEAASQFYFAMPASQLDYLRAATLAGVTQSPTHWDPVVNPENSELRRNTVLGLMLEQGHIDQAQYDAGVATPLSAYVTPTATGLGCMSANAVANAGYFCDYVTKVIVNNPAFGETKNERMQLLYRGGLTITTTLDPTKQAIADAQVKAGVPVDDESGVASAISVVGPGTGEIVAMAQNRIYNPSSTAGPRETSVNYNTDFLYGGSSGFSPGSTFKPFTLVQWLKEGHSLNEVINANLRPYKMNDFNSPECGPFTGADYKFGNAEGKGGVMTVLNATKNSVNSGYIEMASQLDLCGIFETAKSLGIHQPDGSDYRAFPANVIGSDSVAPLTMAAAFAAFAANGTYCEPIALRQVLDADGNELPVPSANCREAIEPQIAAAMSYALSHVWEGTAKGLGGIGRPSAGKTGTTSHNEETWFVGYTPQLAAAVWVGYAEGVIPVQGKTINGRWVNFAYGSTIAAPTWQRFMRQALEGQPVVPFPEARSQEINGQRVTVPRVEGRSESRARSTLRDAGFIVRVAREREASDVRAGSVAGTTPGAGSRVSRGSVVTIVLSSGPEREPEPDEADESDEEDRASRQGERAEPPTDDATGSATDQAEQADD